MSTLCSDLSTLVPNKRGKVYAGGKREEKKEVWDGICLKKEIHHTAFLNEDKTTLSSCIQMGEHWESISHIKMELGLSSTSLNMQKMILDVDSFSPQRRQLWGSFY